MDDVQGCRLYLALPRTADAALAPGLTAALEAGDVACILLRAPDRGALATLLPLAQAAGVAVLIEDDIELALATDADGVHLTDPSTYAAARPRLGKDRIIGVLAGASRHDAMEAAEAGADYVALDGDLIPWWAELMTVPVVALGTSDLDSGRERMAAGADFLFLDDWIWAEAANPAAIIARF